MEFLFTENWNKYLDNFQPENKDIYFKKEYISLYKTDNEVPSCAVITDSENIMLFPFLKRSFEYKGKQYSDFETAYGYGGPIFNTKDCNFIEESVKLLYKKFVEYNYIAGFVRFHPLLNNYNSFNEIGTVILDRKTVAIDLTLSEEDIWMNEIHTKNRNVIKKAIKEDLKFVVDDKFEYLNRFIDLYNSTMNKLNADNFYYFKEDYYNNFIENINDSFLGVVLKKDKVISAAIFMYSGDYGHYHLSGSDKNYLKYSPNNFMLYKAALELKARNIKYFHLGGGTTSDENDSLFCFKNKFSKRLYQFAIGKLIFNDDIYKSLCEDWEKRWPEKTEHYKHYLLKYKY